MRIWSVLALSLLALVAIALIDPEGPEVSAGEGAGGTGPIAGEGNLGKGAREHPLPLPSTMTTLEFQRRLNPFVLSRDYATKLGWMKDKGVRDTGPYVRGKYYGTHPAVRIYYSPKVVYWMTGNPDYWPEGKASGAAVPKAPREGKIPDGAMIVKEMFAPPAARYDEMTEEAITATLFTPTSPGFTVMVKDAAGAPDGWFWAAVWKDQHDDTPERFSYPEAGFTMACVRCHSVAEEGGTFVALRNMEGFPGDPIAFFVDETWRTIPRELQPFTMVHGPNLPELPVQREPGPCEINPEFLYTFGSLDGAMGKVCYEEVVRFPPESNDHVPPDAQGLKPWMTSDTCMMCHSGANSAYAFGPIMFLETARGGLNVSPYGEWRWSPMGLAGRDPVFHAQLESEISMLQGMLPAENAKEYADQVVNTCGRCHFAMGKRQYDHDQGVGDAYWDPHANFQREWFQVTDPKDPHFDYGALGRDGISCAVCHRMVNEHPGIADYLAHSITGQFAIGPANEMYGPFEDVVTRPMKTATGAEPKHSEFLKSSRVCASCHIISLPVVDWPLDAPPAGAHAPPAEEVQQLLASERNPHFQGFLHRIEQATYLEWLNSRYQDEIGGKTEHTKSCQDCHMRTEYRSLDGKIVVDPIQTKIATIEDEDYPEADYRIPRKDLTVKFRTSGFRRHTFQGLNVFLAEMFNQFHDVLGVRRGDFETGVSGLPFAIENFVQNAREHTADVDIVGYEVDGQTIKVDVRVTNLTGHRLPSGVGFRRLFLEVQVLDDSTGVERVVWASGATNGVGVIVDGEGEILPEEFFEEDAEGKQRYHPHHQVITREDQAQVYEELATDASGRITTSFIRRAHHLKENRLVAIGFSREGPGPELPAAFLHATWPGHETENDPEYWDGSGSDLIRYEATLSEVFDCSKVRVKVTLCSQAWAPYYLRDRFRDVPDGPEGDARRRLYYLASHLETEGTPIEDWKLEVASDVAPKAEPHVHDPAEGDVCPECGETHEDNKGCG
jgi:hypothetical protein